MSLADHSAASDVSAESPPTRLLITDLDNTLYDWVDYFAPAFRAMVHALSARLGLQEDALTDEFRKIYSEYGTAEYPFTVQLLPVVQSLDAGRREELIQVARTAFGGSRRKRLRPYPGVHETLAWARKSGLTVVVVTSGPSHVVAPKLNQLGLLGFISLLVAWEGFELPPTVEAGKSPIRAKVPTKSLPREAFTPKAEAYLAAMAEVGCDVRATAIVGDSLRSDIAPALELGLPAYWARYGLEFSPKNLQTIEAITPGGPDVVRQAYATQPVPAGTGVLEHFSDLQRLLATPQPTLF